MLRSENLSYSYAESFSLKNLSLHINSGEIVGIIGHSGSGKSTLLHILAGLKEPEEGKIFLDEKPLLTPAKKLVPGHEKIKLVTQQNSLFPNISVFENIAYELRYYEKEYQNSRVSTLAQTLNLKHLMDKLPRQLSGGEVQRVMIAKALADEPWVLLLDEPMANLDRIHKKQVMLSLNEVVKVENIACIMVTHDIYDAFGMTDRLAIMSKGNVIQNGSSEDIYFKPINLYAAELTGEVNFLNGQYFRPENVVFDAEGELTGTVKACIFQGAYYEVLIETTEVNILARSISTLTIGQEYNFRVTSFIHLD